MSSNNSNASSNRRGRGGRRGRSGRGRGASVTSGPTNASAAENEPTKATPAPAKAASVDGDDGICWICAEPVKFYALAECNHRTCHVCALRLRALYKRTDCTFCKVRCAMQITCGGWLTIIGLAPSSCDYIHIVWDKIIFRLYAQRYSVLRSQTTDIVRD
jgi:hypothetical protein